MNKVINGEHIPEDGQVGADLKENGGENLPPVDAEASVTVYDHGMTARIFVSRPKNGGRPLDRAMIDAALAAQGVVFGIDAEKIESLAAKPLYNINIIFARGREAVTGKDGSLIYRVERETHGRPKEREDGTVDYRELGLIQHVEEGQILVERIAPAEGEDGCDVQGNVLPARAGKDVALPAGKNTAVSPDGLSLVAEKTGHVEFMGGKVVVQDTYTVPGDVSSATGNITFSGNVIIRGSVLAGFTINATGNVNIRGACEAATIISGGNVSIGEGMNGGSITAEGDIKSKYLQNCSGVAGANIYTDSVINCELSCGDSLIVAGGKGTLIGGRCSATNLIECATIGSRNTHVVTWVEVGLDPKVQDRLQEAPKEYEQAAHFIASLDNVIGMMAQLEAANRLDDERLEQLRSARYTRGLHYNNYLALKEEMSMLAEKAKALGFGTIIAKNGIAPGVRIVIGPYQTPVTDFKPNTKVTRGEEGISFNMAV